MSNTNQNPKSFELLDGDLDEPSLNLLAKADKIAVDTEAMGLIHGRDRLCLIQLCDEEDNVICIRIHKENQNAPKLKLLMENKNIEKIFHYARFDVAALAENLDIHVKTIFCTKIASKIGRTYSPRHGLKEVVMELLNIELDKQAQSTDWGRSDELSKKQLVYASNDVRFLIKARNKLEQMLRREGRWELTLKCFNCIAVFSELDRSRFANIFDH